jgi:hypothetical protein
MEREQIVRVVGRTALALGGVVLQELLELARRREDRLQCREERLARREERLARRGTG